MTAAVVRRHSLSWHETRMLIYWVVLVFSIVYLTFDRLLPYIGNSS